MTMPCLDSYLIVYLLHFDQKLGDRLHYIGSTTFGRRHERWREHALGLGSAYTRRFIRKGIGFNVVRYWFVAARDVEMNIKKRGDYAAICPFCTPNNSHQPPVHYDAMAWTPSPDIGWLQQKRPHP
jgi:hypothetical protein